MGTKKLLVQAALLVGCVAMLAGCPNAQQIANDLQSGLDQETAQFNTMSSAASLRGEAPATALRTWSNSLSELSGRLISLRDRLSRRPQERAGSEANLQLLRSRLEVVTGRTGLVRLQIPSWMIESARRDVERATATVSEIRRSYRILFSADAPQTNPLVLQVTLDEGVVDTKPDCVTMMVAFGVAHNDGTCRVYADEVCGHQMNLGCVTQQLLLNATQECSQTVRSERGIEDQVRAGWLSTLASCRSATPVLRGAR